MLYIKPHQYVRRYKSCHKLLHLVARNLEILPWILEYIFAYILYALKKV